MGGQAGRDLLSVVGELVDVGQLGDVEAGGAGAQLEREQVGRPAGVKAEAGQVTDWAAADGVVVGGPMDDPPRRRRWRPAPVLLGAALLVVLTGLAASQPWVVLLAVGAVVTVGLLATWVVVVPRRLASPPPAEVLDRLGDRDRLEVTNAQVKLQNDLRTTALQTIAGLAVLAGVVLGFQQLAEDRQQATATRELTLQGQASDRFTRAIDQLGSDRLEARLGGIYGLEQIAQQAPANRLPVTEVLVAYLHRRVPRLAKPPPDTSPVEELRTRVPDAHAALTVLGRRQIAPADPPLDLQALDFRGAVLGAVLSDADHRNTDLNFANLRGADLRGADISNTELIRADLSGANLRGALLVAQLSGANLSGANLRGAVLDADLTGAEFVGADLRGATLRGDLSLAQLRGANLRGANLRGANLSGVLDLSGATADQRTAWPDGFDWRGAGVRLETSPGP
jgi:hypothetical protein